MDILLIVLILVLLLGGVGTLPSWSYSAGWGYGPSGIVWVLLVVVLIIWLVRGRV